ncbi:MAG TPA: CDP-diacylglycerol--glycerol-3-phosphate 3-phosphatidyltransferase [Candidatus Ornithomonoglobus merdipullorum]|uniref:CDP-diacylglycerol--glycerol-3-phosphate 3-phosphatidyltransferase n=1 Tax=Candidatus Ornithomonoglobus merdipullorum TaxID=2840895 RepID=A0A9D1MAV1_9FIRM|nr:CDP-diacylglycerol--glycerol-3-phosphate 3-phosphatidyltransferase [Candidatus Ornithomonoglobus merdipullorum]
MNLPNKLTLLRVVLALVFMAFMMVNAAWAKWVGLLVFAGASLTDMLDGKIARSRNMITTFGKFADPLADKMLTTAAFIIFTYKQIIGPWPLFIILIREFAVSGIRLVAAANGDVIAASFWGKFKTVTQMIAILAGILIMCLPHAFGSAGNIITAILVWISVLFTIISGIEYIVNNRKLLKFK